MIKTILAGLTVGCALMADASGLASANERKSAIGMDDGESVAGLRHETSEPAVTNAEDAMSIDDSNTGSGVDIALSPERGLAISAFGGAYTFRLGGRLFIDGAYYFKDKNDLGSSVEARAARLEASGSVLSDWRYALSTEFADLDVDVKDAYVSYLGFRPIRLDAGQFKEPFGLEVLTSAKHITFMERALPSAFAPGRNVGLAVRGSGTWWTASVGSFIGNFADEFSYAADEGWGMTGRATAAPINTGTRLLHLGASASHRDPDDDDTISFKSRPESGVTDVSLVNTGQIRNLESVRRFGIEAAGVYGPLSLQGEYISTFVDRESGHPDVNFDGWYASASWFVTGEARNYLAERGIFGQITPEHEYGAVELAARISAIDLSSASVTGGEEGDVTLGVNWYINPYLRLMSNFIFVWSDTEADDNGNVEGDDQPIILQGRLQVSF